MDLVTDTFNEWWQKPKNQQGFWRRSKNGVAISLGETPRYIFSQILQLLKCQYHDRNVGYGNLLEGVRIDENEQVHLDPNPNINLEPFASIKKDFLDFEDLVTWVEDLITLTKNVQPAYSSRKFHDLCRLLVNDVYYTTVGDLRRFGFFMRNNPLFLDETAKYLFFKKVLTIKEYNVAYFSKYVPLSSDIEDWFKDVRNTVLVNVKNFQSKTGSGNPTNQSGNLGGNPTSQSGMHKKRKRRSGNPKSQSGGHPTSQDGNQINQRTYVKRDGSIVFFRNCFGHVRKENPAAHYHDAKILHALEADLPKVIPVWFYDLVVHLDLNERRCIRMCKYSWMEFLSKRPSVFT